MNTYQQLRQLILPKRRMIARILHPRGEHLVAATPNGETVILRGEANIGDHVYYDIHTLTILERAPAVQWIEIDV